ncbi:hypothetical protein QNI23_008115 [Bermanella sp. WJH001]|uniref:hypothetical protein n=1 Tax=Bermanella sp. WJH001 TaxID=3048005 RepID=UPI0024BDB0A3|nr:hypothetical protein [Bermanella sp. WJH001]MDJ1536956.1 hypothetical protein [Bermanella sp. WJH001]
MSYQHHFLKQIEFIENSASLFDLGKINESIRIAVSLRVLMHDTKNSTSLLSHMEKKQSMKILSTSWGGFKDEKSFGFSLTGIQMAGNSIEVTPNLHRYDKNKARNITISEWWEENVFSSPVVGLLSRRDFALIAANKDGGAHVDKLPDKFKKIKDGDVGFIIPNVEVNIGFGQLWPCTLRQMAWELLNSEDFIVQSKLT